MSKFKSSGFRESLYYAIRGIKLAFSSQRNFVREVIITILVIFSAFLLKFNHVDICILLIMCLIVLLSEIMNSIIEFTLDSMFKNTYSKLVEMAKDMAAGMVLLASIFSVVVGIIVFGSNLIKYLPL